MKKIILFIFLLLLLPVVNAKTSSFSEKDFIKYFKKNNYERYDTKCLNEKINFDFGDCTTITFINKELKQSVELYRFGDKKNSIAYFKKIYELDSPNIKDIDKFQVDNIENYDFAYFIRNFSDINTLYMICIDNYLITANVNNDNIDYINDVFDDLDMIDNPNKKNSDNKYLIVSILCIIFVVFNTLVINKIVKDRKNKQKNTE